MILSFRPLEENDNILDIRHFIIFSASHKLVLLSAMFLKIHPLIATEPPQEFRQSWVIKEMTG